MRPGTLTTSVELFWKVQEFAALYGDVFRGDAGWESMEDFGKVYGGRESISRCAMARKASGDVEKDLMKLLFAEDAEVKLSCIEVAQDEARES